MQQLKQAAVLYLPGYLKLFPRCFATGTSKKPYTTCTTNRSEYSEDFEPIPNDYEPNTWDLARARSLDDIEYLLRPHHCGEVYVTCRGKQLALAAGHVRFIPSFTWYQSLIKHVLARYGNPVRIGSQFNQVHKERF